MRPLRRLGLTLVALVLLLVPLHAAITEVGSGTQRANCGGSGSDVPTFVCAFPNDVTSGNWLVAAGGVTHAFGGPYTSLSASGAGSGCSGTTFSVVFSAFSSTVSAYIAHGQATASGPCTITITPDVGTYWASLSVDEFSGVIGLDAAGAGDGGNSTSPSTDVTTTSADTLVLGAISWRNAVSNTVGMGLTEFGNNENWATCCNHSSVLKLQAAVGSTTTEWTLGSSVAWSAIAVALASTTPSPSGGGSGTTPSLGPFLGGPFVAWTTPTWFFVVPVNFRSPNYRPGRPRAGQ